jgi:hypothetical protein
MDRLVKEAIEIRLHPDNFNRDNGFILSHAWHPLINQLHKARQVKQHPESLEPERTEPRLSDTNREQAASVKDRVKRHKDWLAPGRLQMLKTVARYKWRCMIGCWTKMIGPL